MISFNLIYLGIGIDMIDITVEDAIRYVADFGGYDKAMRLRSQNCFLTYSEYLYHKECLMIFIEYCGGDYE